MLLMVNQRRIENTTFSGVNGVGSLLILMLHPWVHTHSRSHTGVVRGNCQRLLRQ